jgi:hypothetical protein
MNVFVDGFLATDRPNFPLVTQVPTPVTGGGGGTLITIVLGMLLAAFLFVLILLYRASGIGRGGKSKFLVYTSFAVFVIILGISAIVFSSRIPFIGEFGSLIGLVAVVIALILGVLIYVTYRNEMDFAKEVELERKDLEQKGNRIETDVQRIIEETSQREKASEERKEKSDELLDICEERKKNR